MFNLRETLRRLKGRVWHSLASDRVPLDPTRIDELDLSKWGMGDVRPNLEEDPRGGYGGACIPGKDLPTSIPRTGEPPTAAIARSMCTKHLRPLDGKNPQSLLVDNDFAFTHLEEVKRDVNSRPAAITNGYDRAILLQGPVLALQLQAGETRTIAGPVFQRVPKFPRYNHHASQATEKFNPSAFTIKAWSAYDVLRDMAAERTRSILRNEPVEKWATDLEFAPVDEILKLSKFTVQEL